METSETVGFHLSEQGIKTLEQQYLFPTYSRSDLFVSHGSGVHVYDFSGKRYLDLLAGIAVNSLGYSHPRLVRVLQDQSKRVIHCSNLFYHPYQGLLARKLAEISGLSKVFFTNSGTESVEAALKIARAYGHTRNHGNDTKSVILTLRNSFHGRTFGALSVTTQEKYQDPFRPLVPDVKVVEDTTVSALEEAFSDRICGLVMEPIQGEGGVVPLPPGFMRAGRELCNRYDALLIFDEIQCGMGRTGRYFAFQHYDLQPDVLTLAKSLAGGYPLGAVLGSMRVADCFRPGDHGTTFGGGPLACRLALEVLDVIEQEGLLGDVNELGDYLTNKLKDLASRHDSVGEVRGMGLMIGVHLGSSAKEVVKRLLKRGIIANAAHETVLRILPPFIITRNDIDEFIKTLDEVLSDLKSEEQGSDAESL